MDLLRSGTLAALLLVLPGAAGCQSLFSKARIENPEEVGAFDREFRAWRFSARDG